MSTMAAFIILMYTYHEAYEDEQKNGKKPPDSPKK